MKRVLNIVFGMYYGGTESFILNTKRNIKDNKISFDFLYLNDKVSPRDEELKSNGSRIYKGKDKLYLNKFSLISQIYKTIKLNNFKVIHSHLNELNGLIVFAAYLGGAQKRISHLHFPHYYNGKNFFKFFYYKFQTLLIEIFSTEIFYCSEPTFESYKLSKRVRKKSFHIRNTIDLNKFFAAEYNKKKYHSIFSIPEESKIVTNITRFDNNKNQKFIVEVFLEMLRNDDNLILILGGEGLEENNIKNLVNEYQINDKVRFIGVRNDVAEILKISDLYLFPSVEEGFGIVVLEAQACKLNIICSTNVPESTDLKLELAHYLDLKNGAKYWSEYAINLLKSQKNSLLDADIINAFDKYGFNEINQSMIIEKVYLNEKF